MPIPNTPPTKTQTSDPAITLDWEAFLPYLANTDATDQEKRALIETVTQIMIGFADLHFDIAPPKQTSGQVVDLAAVLHEAVLNLQRSAQTQKEDA
ncbi:hypothetical protein [Roseobacter sp.]|uniref:hypothetical protein n=1 Tax=Roseobacter sp. TaxID=1907202 RepID=UPI0032986D42